MWKTQAEQLAYNSSYYQRNKEKLKIQAREYRLANPDRIKKTQKRRNDFLRSKYASDAAYKQKIRAKATSLVGRYSQYSCGARRRGLAFTITVEEFDCLTSKPCWYCDRMSDKKSGLDRLDNSCGYIDGNAIPCCMQCNLAKRASDVDDFITMCILVAEKFNGQQRFGSE